MGKSAVEKRTAIQIVRETLKLDRGPFAAAVGFSEDKIRNVERRKNEPSEELKVSVAAYAGVLPWSLSLDKQPRDFRNRRYTRQSWNDWQQLTFKPEEVRRLACSTHRALSLLLRTTREKRNLPTHDVFRSFVFEFDAFLNQQMRKRGLEGRVSDLLKKRTMIIRNGDSTALAVHSILGDHPVWLENRQEHWEGDTPIKWRERRWQIASPLMSFASIGGRGVFNHAQVGHRQEFFFVILGRKFSLVIDSIEAQVQVQLPGLKVPDRAKAILFPAPQNEWNGNVG